MKKIKTLTLASLLAAIAFAGGFASDASAQGIVVHERPSDSLVPTDLSAQKVQKVTPTDQPGRLEAKGFSWGLKVGEQQGVGTPDTMPTDQKVQKVNTLSSLNTLRTTDSLFANSKGGDQGNGLLLPAVRATGLANQQANAGASVPDAPERGALNFANGAHGAGGGGGAGKSLNFSRVDAGVGNPGTAQGSINFANNANNASKAAGAVTPGVAKGSINFTNTAKR